MARLHNKPAWLGTKNGICIYAMRGEFFARAASSLTAERVLTEPVFAETRRHSGIMARASRVGSRVYKEVTGARKTHDLYRKIAGQAYKLIMEGEDEKAIVDILIKLYR